MKVAAVIVTFNRKQLLLEVLKALKCQKRPVDQIYIIDNCSTDGTPEYLANNNMINLNDCDYLEDRCIYNSENTTYIRLNDNLGGAGGFYNGIKIAYENNYDWICIMDDDIYPASNALSEYMKFIENSELEISALMGTREYEGEKFYFESVEHNFSNPFKLEFKKASKYKLNKEEYFEIKDIPFEGPIINANIIKRIGLPTPEFFIICDDTDYAIRLGKEAPIYCLDKVRLIRLINPFVSTQKDNFFNWKDYYTLRNIIYLNKTYGDNKGVKYIRTLGLCIKKILSIFMKVIKTGKISELRKISKILKAYIKGIKGNLGKDYVPGDF